jgi:hypothetical protein
MLVDPRLDGGKVLLSARSEAAVGLGGGGGQREGSRRVAAAAKRPIFGASTASPGNRARTTAASTRAASTGSATADTSSIPGGGVGSSPTRTRFPQLADRFRQKTPGRDHTLEPIMRKGGLEIGVAIGAELRLAAGRARPR